jgi:shikimate dehydrogenase
MKQFGLIGYPLGHSFSKKYFTQKFENEKINSKYELYELPSIEDFVELKSIDTLYGLNVTIPYKEQVIPYLDELDQTAEAIGAVNVIKFIRKGESLHLKGYNSDAIGFENSLKPLLKAEHNKALILGTGGASKAIDYTLRKLGIETKFVSRTAKDGVLSYQDLNQSIIDDYLVIVNASPVGTFPHVDECPSIPYEFLTPNHVLFDAVYNPAETLFLKKGKKVGCSCLNGELMLIGQAEEAWQIWNNESH